MRFRPEHYLEASQERIDDARRLHNIRENFRGAGRLKRSSQPVFH